VVDSFENIPIEIVSTHWDSTLNSKFDKQCAVNVATPMTPSERACAAGHVMVWKLISDLSTERTIQVNHPQAIAQKIPPIILNASRSSSLDTKITKEELQQLSKLYSSNQWCHHHHHPKGGGGSTCGYYLIFEDDFEIKSWLTVDHHRNTHRSQSGFMAKVKEIQRQLPADTDICYLGYVKPYDETWKQCGKTFLQPTYLWQLHAYLLSPSGAKKLLSSLPVNSPVDNFIAKLIYEGTLKVRETGVCACPPRDQSLTTNRLMLCNTRRG
jgi:GR25 family glycosyltransferase involved in LPS biosynthesis